MYQKVSIRRKRLWQRRCPCGKDGQIEIRLPGGKGITCCDNKLCKKKAIGVAKGTER